MKQLVTNITIFFQGTKKGKRKIELQSERVTQLLGHLTISSDDFNKLEREAWSLVDSLGYKNISKASLSVNHGYDEDGMTFVQLLPKQKQLIMR